METMLRHVLDLAYAHIMALSSHQAPYNLTTRMLLLCSAVL